MLIESLLEPVVESWERRQFGLRLAECETGITHAIWADNVWLIATSASELRTMTDELTEAIYSAKLQWKASSLEILCAGRIQSTTPEMTILTPSLDLLTYKVVRTMEVLGSLLDSKGSIPTPVQHRTCKAEAGFWAKSKVYLGLGSVRSKLKA